MLIHILVFEHSHYHKTTYFEKKNTGKVYTCIKQNENVNKAFSSEALGQNINPSCPIGRFTFEVRFNSSIRILLMDPRWTTDRWRWRTGMFINTKYAVHRYIVTCIYKLYYIISSIYTGHWNIHSSEFMFIDIVCFRSAGK